ncbi:sodium:solute symporter family protein [Candidatus Chrysopegis kryptomonas]|uniref:Solute:Na+ symporter, SSS family n=1 Tax=Candidatus Chryseopegocella kryptomonas TaxID=1633643 RepID=A0A0N7MY99_9BACT|nr:sodium:solute symporter family protein [Candidatus Chrysopegis kryptomonas]CUT03651.1 solute:Na+ symporter, SSS family [Candidatus Chrysopegis kryptomonas]
MRANLAIEDIILIVLYFASVLFIGFRAKKKDNDAVEEYLLAGRSITLPMFVATLVSTWYGGILGVGEFTYKYGISVWLVFGLPYYIFGALFAFLLAEKVRKSKLFTIPDRLAQVYDKKTSFLGTILTLILVTPAPYFLMLGVLFQMIFNLDLKLSIVLSTILSVSYLFAGGFRSDVYTDIFEFFLMFAGFGLIIPFASAKFGGIDFLLSNLPDQALSLTGGNSIQYIIAWFLIAIWTLVDPGFYQRCYAAKDGKTAKYGILIAILFWMIFDFMTMTAGLYARAILPNLDQPIMAYPSLAEVVLPKVAKGLFYIGMLATIMSTLNTLTFISAVTIGNDIIWKLKKTHNNEAKINFYTRIGLLITLITSILFAIYFPSVVDLWYIIGTLTIPGLLIPVITTYFENLTPTPRVAFLTMLSGFLFSLLSFVLGYIFKSSDGTPSYPFGLEPMFPGLLASLLVYIAGKLRE